MRARELWLAAAAVLISGGLLAFLLWGPGLGRTFSERFAQAHGAFRTELELLDELAGHVRRANVPCPRAVRASHINDGEGRIIWDVRCSPGSDWRLLVDYDRDADGYDRAPRPTVSPCDDARLRPRCWDGPDRRPEVYGFY